MSEYNEHAYDQLAGFLSELNEYGRHDYSRESLRDSLAAAHILSRDGELNSDRMERYMESRAIPIPNFGDMDVDEFWQEIAEGDYF